MTQTKCIHYPKRILQNDMLKTNKHWNQDKFVEFNWEVTPQKIDPQNQFRLVLKKFFHTLLAVEVFFLETIVEDSFLINVCGNETIFKASVYRMLYKARSTW